MPLKSLSAYPDGRRLRPHPNQVNGIGRHNIHRSGQSLREPGSYSSGDEHQSALCVADVIDQDIIINKCKRAIPCHHQS